MKTVVNYLIFVFHIEVKTKSKNKILNFVFQFIKITEWHFGYTESKTTLVPNCISANIFDNMRSIISREISKTKINKTTHNILKNNMRKNVADIVASIINFIFEET